MLISLSGRERDLWPLNWPLLSAALIFNSRTFHLSIGLRLQVSLLKSSSHSSGRPPATRFHGSERLVMFAFTHTHTRVSLNRAPVHRYHDSGSHMIVVGRKTPRTDQCKQQTSAVSTPGGGCQSSWVLHQSLNTPYHDSAYLKPSLTEKKRGGSTTHGRGNLTDTHPPTQNQPVLLRQTTREKEVGESRKNRLLNYQRHHCSQHAVPERAK